METGAQYSLPFRCISSHRRKNRVTSPHRKVALPLLITAEKEREGGNPKNGGAGYHAKGDDTVVSMARKPKSRLFELQATQGFSVAEIEASLG